MWTLLLPGEQVLCAELRGTGRDTPLAILPHTEALIPAQQSSMSADQIPCLPCPWGGCPLPVPGQLSTEDRIIACFVPDSVCLGVSPTTHRPCQGCLRAHGTKDSQCTPFLGAPTPQWVLPFMQMRKLTCTPRGYWGDEMKS